MGCWGIVKKNRPPPKGARGELGRLQPKNNRKIEAVWEGQNRQEWRGEEEGPGGGGLFGNWVKGLPSPCWDSPQPLRSGRKGAACNPHGQVWGCQMLRAGGWRGLTKACPPGR